MVGTNQELDQRAEVEEVTEGYVLDWDHWQGTFSSIPAVPD